MVKGLLRILGKVFTIGQVTVPTIVGLVTPVLGNLVGQVLNAVLRAESKYGSGNGRQKAEAVSEALEVAAPSIVLAIEMQTGRELADEAKLASGLAKLQDALVDILNAFGLLLPHGAAAEEKAQ